MDNMYIAVLGILLLLAAFDLIVGVSNDAANFLNSAIGSRAAKRSTIVACAAIGVVLGASFSSGMMEVARNGIFVPAEFSFHEVMMIFLAVMLTDVILLDLFNTFGMPTSTTVSLVFELLGAAVAMAIYKMNAFPEISQDLGDYINTGKLMQIIMGIFSSVTIAFSCGCLIMWFSRILFSFHYKKSYRYVGSLWCAIALSSITYFAVFKGLSKSSLIDKESMQMLNDNIWLALACCFAFWFVTSSILQFLFKVNMLRVTVLAGTAALALAFAGNDLVNFIGVFMAAKSSLAIATDFAASGGDYVNMPMSGLSQAVQAEVGYLLAAGLIMVGALLFSRKARTVSETEVKLARVTSGKERFGSSLASRALVRYVLNITRVLKLITPMPVQAFIAKRFTPLDPSEEDGAAFDLVRATVNLTTSALLISLATSLKLPLSTTYVTFMVAMGTSLTDRAWGRDSAVYRITGVLAVIGGWFMTGIAAFTAAFLSATILAYWGAWGIGFLIILVIAILIKTTLHHRKNSSREVKVLDLTDRVTLRQMSESSASIISQILKIHSAAIKALLDEDRSTLKRMRRRARGIERDIKHRKEDEILPSLHNLPTELAKDGQMLYSISESTKSISESLYTIVSAAYIHIDNHHRGLSEEQAHDLIEMNNKVGVFFPNLCQLLESGNFEDIDRVMAQAGDLGEEFADCITRHLAKESDDVGHMRSSILYLNLLNETRAMVRKSFSLIKEQKHLYHK